VFKVQLTKIENAQSTVSPACGIFIAGILLSELLPHPKVITESHYWTQSKPVNT